MAKKEPGGATGEAAAAPVQRRIEATTFCFNEEAAPAGKYAVRVECNVKESLQFRRRDGQRVLRQKRAAGTDTATTTFPIAEIASAGACRFALRRIMEALPQLRSLHLDTDEWDAVVPDDVVPEIVRAACRGDGMGFTFCVRMAVRRWVIHDERALLMAWKETPPGEQNECAICFDGLEAGEPAVELPVCEHGFHRRCISKWFFRATTCPMCRSDVRLSALPDFLELCSSTGEAAQGTILVLPDLDS